MNDLENIKYKTSTSYIENFVQMYIYVFIKFLISIRRIHWLIILFCRGRGWYFHTFSYNFEK